MMYFHKPKECLKRDLRKRIVNERTQLEETGNGNLIKNLKISIKEMIDLQREIETNKIRIVKKLKNN